MNRFLPVLCLLFVLMSASVLLHGAFPVERYDFHTPYRQPSPVITAMGGLNVTHFGDQTPGWNNPALLAWLGTGNVATVFKLEVEQDIPFQELLSAGNILKRNQLQTISFYGEGVALDYQPLADINAMTTSYDSLPTREYTDYRMDSYSVAFSNQFTPEQKKEENFSYGASLRIISGRIVYLREDSPDSTGWNTAAFIDDDALGFTTDYGFLYNTRDLRLGLVFYDLWSRVYWDDSTDRSLKQRVAAGVEWGGKGWTLTSGYQRLLHSGKGQTYHMGGAFNLGSFGNPKNPQRLILRMGVYSEDFSDTDKTWISLGTGYYVDMFRLDFSMKANGGTFENSKYQISLSLGL